MLNFLRRSASVKTKKRLRTFEPEPSTDLPAPLLPLFAPSSRVRRFLPRNSFTPDEIAEALRLLTEHALLSPPACVTVVWSKNFSRVLRPEEVALINDPERIKRVSVDCTFPAVRRAGITTRVHGDLIKPYVMGLERRGALFAEGGGHARSSLNVALGYLASVRPWGASVRATLMSGILLIPVIVTVGAAIPVATFFLAPGGLEPPSLFGPTTIAIYTTDAVLVGFYYFVVLLLVGGTRIVNPPLVIGVKYRV